MLESLDGLVPQVLTTDTYRIEAMAYLTNVTLTSPLWERRKRSMERYEIVDMSKLLLYWIVECTYER